MQQAIVREEASQQERWQDTVHVLVNLVGDAGNRHCSGLSIIFTRPWSVQPASSPSRMQHLGSILAPQYAMDSLAGHHCSTRLQLADYDTEQQFEMISVGRSKS